MGTAFIYNEEWAGFSYGETHPMKPLRLKLTFELSKALGLLNPPNVTLIEGRTASLDEILTFHTEDYINVLREADEGRLPKDALQYGLGAGDNPPFRGVFRWSSLVTGASIKAAELVAGRQFPIAFSIAGGLHHAMRSKASGFCYINDAVIAINTLLDKGLRVAYLDIDAHHGDGVQWAFYDRGDVLTISIHESGDFLFPGTGRVDEIGKGKGRGFSINLPLPPHTDDELYYKAFMELVPPLISKYKPDILVTQLGVDTLESDPLTHLNLSLNGFERVVKEIKALSLPWVALGGGGYDVEKVAKAWTIALGVMTDRDVPERIPLNIMKTLGFSEDSIRDTPINLPQDKREGLWKGIKRDIELLKSLP